MLLDTPEGVGKGRGYMETKNLLYSTSFAIFGSRCLNHPYLTLGVCVSCGRTQRLQSPPPPAAKYPGGLGGMVASRRREAERHSSRGSREGPRLGSWPYTSNREARIPRYREAETTPKGQFQGHSRGQKHLEAKVKVNSRSTQESFI